MYKFQGEAQLSNVTWFMDVQWPYCLELTSGKVHGIRTNTVINSSSFLKYLQ